MKFAVIAVAGLLSLGAARADVIPPPEPITDVQQALVGVWQQTATTGMMGHGEGLETLTFDKEHFGSLYLFALPVSAMYEAEVRRGTWTGERISDTEIKVTLTFDDGTPPQELDVRITGDATIEIPKMSRGRGLVPYKRVYP